MHIHTCVCARDETSNKTGIWHRSHGDVKGFVIIPESSEAKFSRLI